MSESMNTKPFSHKAGRFEFSCPQCDLRGGLTIHAPRSYTQLELVAAVAEMIGYHAVAIWPELNGFSGYDAIHWIIQHPTEEGQATPS